MTLLKKAFVKSLYKCKNLVLQTLEGLDLSQAVAWMVPSGPPRVQLEPRVWSWALAPQLSAVPGTEAAPYVGAGLESGLPRRPAVWTLGLSPGPGA